MNGGGEQALAEEEPAEASVNAVKQEHSPLPPMPQTDANDLKEADPEGPHEEQQNGYSLTTALSFMSNKTSRRSQASRMKSISQAV